MKKLMMMALSMTVLGFTQAQADVPAEKEVTVGINSVFVPAGFDTNTDVYVVVSGIFPNGCYRWNRAEILDKTALEHEIQSKAIVQSGMCLMVLVPFTKEVRMGRLPAVEHVLRFLHGDGTYLERKLTVEQ